jgi:hypothetical protein
MALFQETFFRSPFSGYFEAVPEQPDAIRNAGVVDHATMRGLFDIC